MQLLEFLKKWSDPLAKLLFSFGVALSVLAAWFIDEFYSCLGFDYKIYAGITNVWSDFFSITSLISIITTPIFVVVLLFSFSWCCRSLYHFIFPNTPSKKGRIRYIVEAVIALIVVILCIHSFGLMAKVLANSIIKHSFDDKSRLMFSTTLYSDKGDALIDCGLVIGTVGKYTAIIQQSMESAQSPLLISTDSINRVDIRSGVEGRCLGFEGNTKKKAATK